MLKEIVEKELNSQIQAELFSSYLYFAMANYCDSVSLPGAAHWMRMQAMEEMGHVLKFTGFVNDRRGRVKLAPIEAPPVDWDSPQVAFNAAYEHECMISERINKLVDTALANSDHATANFLQWFVEEQVEEEASVDNIVQQMRLAGHSEGGLFHIDKELAGRAPTIPPALTGAGA